jgi:nucleotidyltransferase/DNA polymerase involved in DNA repair
MARPSWVHGLSQARLKHRKNRREVDGWGRPGSHIHQAPFDVYRTVSALIRGNFAEHADLIEPQSLDEAYLDVTENKRNLSVVTRSPRSFRPALKR